MPVVQDPWEEQLQPMRSGGSRWQQLWGLLKSYFTGQTLGSIGEGNVSAQQTSLGQWEMSAPGAGGEQVTGAVRMPWQDKELLETADSFAGALEKLQDPNLVKGIVELMKALHRGVQ